MPMNPNSKKPLTAQMRRFCEEYVVDCIGTEAALRAGYSAKNAAQQASLLLADPRISAEVKRLMDERSARTGITADRVLQRLAEIAFGDVRKLFDGGRLKRVDELDEDVAAMLSGVDVVTRQAGEGEVEHVAKIRRNDPQRALELLGKHLGLFEKDNAQKAPTIVIPGGLEET